MAQLPLPLLPKLVYSPEGFFIHTGVRLVHEAVLNEIRQDHFSIVFVEGAPRTGKTHLSIRLALDASAQGFFPILVEGLFFETEMRRIEGQNSVDSATVVLVDDIEDYFQQANYTDSGVFVHFVEYLRARKASLVVFCGKALSELPVDAHVQSRLNPGLGYIIHPPAEHEIVEIMRIMAQQRGIMLKERKRKYLLKRLPHELPSVEKFLDRVQQITGGEGKALRYGLLKDAL